jgi:hypothetical protein
MEAALSSSKIPCKQFVAAKRGHLIPYRVNFFATAPCAAIRPLEHERARFRRVHFSDQTNPFAHPYHGNPRDWQQKWRNRFKEIHGKTLDFVTYSYEENLLFVNLYFTDKTNFSLDFSLREPAIEPYANQYGDVSTGDYENIKTYVRRKRTNGK